MDDSPTSQQSPTNRHEAKDVRACNTASSPNRVELLWPGKRTEVDRVALPFQRIEIVNESRATREAEKGTILREMRVAEVGEGRWAGATGPAEQGGRP